MFQHTAARRRLPKFCHHQIVTQAGFNTQPLEGGCLDKIYDCATGDMFQHTAARRRLRNQMQSMRLLLCVSTHSRPKAAASLPINFSITSRCFNTQPPEGGCILTVDLDGMPLKVSTHSRPKAAATTKDGKSLFVKVSTHSRPKAAAMRNFMPCAKT